jgi:hypothetical protein
MRFDQLRLVVGDDRALAGPKHRYPWASSTSEHPSRVFRARSRATGSREASFQNRSAVPLRLPNRVVASGTRRRQRPWRQSQQSMPVREHRHAALGQGRHRLLRRSEGDPASCSCRTSTQSVWSRRRLASIEVKMLRRDRPKSLGGIARFVRSAGESRPFRPALYALLVVEGRTPLSSARMRGASPCSCG